MRSRGAEQEEICARPFGTAWRYDLLRKCFLLFLTFWGMCSSYAALTAEIPKIAKRGDREQLLVDGKPYLLLGGELGNSSAGTAAQADEILPRLARMHVNTVLMPVAWEQIEATENHFDFSILDHWIDIAREQNLRLVVLWF